MFALHYSVTGKVMYVHFNVKALPHPANTGWFGLCVVKTSSCSVSGTIGSWWLFSAAESCLTSSPYFCLLSFHKQNPTIAGITNRNFTGPVVTFFFTVTFTVVWEWLSIFKRPPKVWRSTVYCVCNFSHYFFSFLSFINALPLHSFNVILALTPLLCN